MSDQSHAGIGSTISQLFTPPVLAALRNVLSAIAPIFAIFGIVALSPKQIDNIIAIGQSLGVLLGAIAALVGVATPIITAWTAAFKASPEQQVKTVSQIAQDTTQPQSASAQAALVEATAAIANNSVLPKSEAAKQTLISATIALPEVQTIVADKAIADQVTSSDVVASDSVKVISNESGLDTQRGRQ